MSSDPPALPDVPALDPLAGLAWRRVAEQLADWAFARLVNRTDRHGGYYKDKGGEVNTLTKPAKGPQPSVVTRELILRHFRPTRHEDILGGHALTPAVGGVPSVGKWAGFDFDNHGGTPEAAARNLRYVTHLYHKAVALGFRPLLVTWGTGGYHLWLLFDAEVPGAVLHAFAHWFVSDAAAFGYYPAKDGDPMSGLPEANPKQASVKAGGFGNWLRFPGRHHKVKAWAVAFDGEKWAQGADAVALVLSRTGDSPALIPLGAAPAAKPARKGSAPDARPGPGAFRAQADRADVFADYNQVVTLDDVVAWHVQFGGHPVISRTSHRVEFSRQGAKDEKHRFNVEVRDGVPVTYNFSSNAGIPNNDGLSPSQVRCFYEKGTCDTRTMLVFADQLRRERGWPEQGKPAAAGRAVAGPAASASGPPAEAAPAATLPAGDQFEDTPRHTDLANARQFVADHRDNVVYADDLKGYFVFNGAVWERDPNGNITAKLAQQTARRMARAAAERVAEASRAMAATVTEDDRKAATMTKARADADLRWATNTCNEKQLRNMTTLARAHLRIPQAAEVFDTQPWLLNCPNGTVNLRTGELLPHRREDMITKLCPTRYDPAATAPVYRAFLGSIFPTPDAAEYVRLLGGYAATGEVTDQSLVIFHGTGANGKTTLLELWQRVLGPGQYAVTAPPELIVGQGERRHPVEKAVLRGARLAVCQETDDDEALDAKRVKALTGGSRVMARGMRENFAEFPPTHKLFLATNPLPRVKSNDHATWRRVRIVGFVVQYWTAADRAREPLKEYPPHLRADPLLPDRLAAEAEGVLADMVAHAALFYEGGKEVPVPPAIAAAVQTYRTAEDSVGRFFATCCEDAGTRTDRRWRIKLGEFYKAYQEWYKRDIDPDVNTGTGPRAFGQRATARFEKLTIRGTDYYRVGVRLPTDEDEPPTEPKPHKRDAQQPTEGWDALLG